MARLDITSAGIGRLSDGSVVLLDLAYDDMGRALAAGADVAEIADGYTVSIRMPGVGVLENPVVRRAHRPTTDVDRKDAR